MNDPATMSLLFCFCFLYTDKTLDTLLLDANTEHSYFVAQMNKVSE